MMMEMEMEMEMEMGMGMGKHEGDGLHVANLMTRNVWRVGHARERKKSKKTRRRRCESITNLKSSSLLLHISIIGT